MHHILLHLFMSIDALTHTVSTPNVYITEEARPASACEHRA